VKKLVGDGDVEVNLGECGTSVTGRERKAKGHRSCRPEGYYVLHGRHGSTGFMMIAKGRICARDDLKSTDVDGGLLGDDLVRERMQLGQVQFRIHDGRAVMNGGREEEDV